MLNSKRLLAGATIAVGLVIATTAGEAAWFDFGKSRRTPPAAVGDGSVRLVQSSDVGRLNRMEAQMRSMTGQIEELTFQLRQLQDQLKRFQEDADFRFGELHGDASGQAPPRQVRQPVAAGAPRPTEVIGTIAAGERESTAADGVVLGAPPRPLGTLVLDAAPPGGSGQPLDLSSLARGGSGGTELLPRDAPVAGAPPVQTVSIVPTGDPRADYDRAYNLIISGKYDLAGQAFGQFLSTYPGEAAAPDAQYWLGESLFARGRFGEAAEAFRAGYKAYPKSTRAPDTLLKLGLSLAGLGERDAACQIYSMATKQYPQMSNALRQRVKNEQASASC